MDEDVTKLTDEELDKKLEETEEEVDESPDEPAQDEPKDDVPEEPEKPVEETSEPETPQQEAPQISRRQELAIQKILNRKPEQPIQQTPQQDPLDYQTALDADPALLEKLQADRDAATSAARREGANDAARYAETLNWKTSLKIEDPQVKKEYPIFDPKAPEYHPAVANAIYTAFTNTVGYNPGDTQQGIPESVSNPNIGFMDFVHGYMELVDEIAGQKVASTQQNIAKQSAQTGLRPDGSSAKLNLNKDPSQMTDEELDAVLGQAGLATKKR